MDENVFKNNIDIPNKQVVRNKYERVLGLRKACIVLQDCLRVENVLNDISMVHNIPLQYRLINNKLKDRSTKKNMISKKNKKIYKHSKDYPLVDSCLMNRVDKVGQPGRAIRTVTQKQSIVMPKKESIRTKAIENKDIQEINKDLNVSELDQNLKKEKYSKNLLSQKCSSPNQNGTNNPAKKRKLTRNCVPSKRNESFSLNKRSSDKEEAENSDCISLYANSTLTEEHDGYSDYSLQNEETFQMINSVVQNYKESHISDFNEININNNNKEYNVPKNVPNSESLKIISTPKKNSILLKKSLQNVQISRTKEIKLTLEKMNVLKPIFKHFCYTLIITNKCVREKCFFRHDIVPAMFEWYNNNEEYLFNVLDKLASNNFTNFIHNFYLQSLHVYSKSDICYILKIFKKLYELKILTNDVTFSTIEWMKRIGYSIKVIADTLSTIVNNNDFQFINFVSKILKEYIISGEYWITLKNLLLKIENLDPEIVEIILQECISTQSHTEEVNFNIIRKLSNQDRCKVNYNILSSFKKLIKNKEKIQGVKENTLSECNQDIRSSDSCSTVNESESSLETNELINIFEKDTIGERNEKDNNDNVQNENCSLKLYTIDNVPKPYSAHARKKFCKFHVDIYKLYEGFKHNDYGYVMNILNSVKEDQQTFFTRVCYKILCSEINYSQYNLNKLILHSDQTKMTTVSYQILFDICKYALINLAKKNLWKLAYKLIKDIHSMVQSQIRFCKIDAATIMLFAEIYLANQQPIEAFSLLRQTSIMYTDLCKWKVQYTVKDISLRVKIITILLDVFCKKFPVYAYFLLQFLIQDQCSNFYPIDLTNFVNKLVVILLLEKNNHFIVRIVRMINHYNLTLNAITYRALISKLFYINIDLAKCLYQTAVGLGVYSRIQLYPMIYLNVNINLTKEEMYLAILDSMTQLLLHVGHGLGNINPKQFNIYLNFENIPLNKKFTSERKDQCVKMKKSKILMKNILKSQFNPPILMTTRKSDKICKLNNKSVLNYLKDKIEK